MFVCVTSFFISILLMTTFYLLSKKEKWELMLGSSFECGFTSYFYSRYSFSIHYFLIGLIFLFLDLELCVIMPILNLSLMNLNNMNILLLFLLILLLGLVKEWVDGKLVWFK